ncbi:ESX secretion-associated protein EspG [Actinokineospora spheciospongiae]|uniref:ESX secretion-associated protein EspG n=1 Tax=Actinokineospora spheciospongiae TaxID=909613 RepID=UPI000D854DBC|nr:ESX secretion-associated protein EspG [Actinokineospora spheciospongiae]PWW62776.1 ESAT-6 protein secretion system EspG family protein [Actinokineospora spheciospongiae]
MSAAPATRAAAGVDFGLVELDLLATHAGARFPFPLRVPEFGRIAGEREVLLAAAGVTLRSRGLAGERGPLGIAAEVVTALRRYRGTVDLVLAGPDGAVGVVGVVYRSWALICAQRFTGDPATNGVRVRRVAQNTLAEELLRLVPEVEAAVTMPITVPPDGSDPAALDELGLLLPELTGAGQLGANRRAPLPATARAGTELSWLDGPRGRVRVDRAEDGWSSVNSLRHSDLGLALTACATIAGREDDGS